MQTSSNLEITGVFRGYLKKKLVFNAYKTTLFLVKYMGCKGGRLLIIRSAIHAWQGYIPTRHIQKKLIMCSTNTLFCDFHALDRAPG